MFLFHLSSPSLRGFIRFQNPKIRLVPSIALYSFFSLRMLVSQIQFILLALLSWENTSPRRCMCQINYNGNIFSCVWLWEIARVYRVKYWFFICQADESFFFWIFFEWKLAISFFLKCLKNVSFFEQSDWIIYTSTFSPPSKFGIINL